MAPHGGFGAGAIALCNGVENGGVLVLHRLVLGGCIERDEPEAERSFVETSQQLGQHGILCRSGDEQVKFPVEQHHVADVPQVRPMLRPLDDIGELGEVRVVRMLRRKAGAIGFVDQSDFDDLQNLIEADGLDDHALAGDHLDHAFDHQAIERLMNRRPADLEHGG